VVERLAPTMLYCAQVIGESRLSHQLPTPVEASQRIGREIIVNPKRSSAFRRNLCLSLSGKQIIGVVKTNTAHRLHSHGKRLVKIFNDQLLPLLGI